MSGQIERGYSSNEVRVLPWREYDPADVARVVDPFTGGAIQQVDQHEREIKRPVPVHGRGARGGASAFRGGTGRHQGLLLRGGRAEPNRDTAAYRQRSSEDQPDGAEAHVVRCLRKGGIAMFQQNPSCRVNCGCGIDRVV